MKKVAMKEEPATSGFHNDENEKIDDENDNEAEKGTITRSQEGRRTTRLKKGSTTGARG